MTTLTPAHIPAIAGLLLLFLWLFFGLYALVMALYRAWLRGNMPPLMQVLGAPYLAIGLAFDVAANVLVASVIFLEPPREWLVTTRLSRLEDQFGWRGDLARWVCTHLLDPLDPTGEHCKPSNR